MLVVALRRGGRCGDGGRVVGARPRQQRRLIGARRCRGEQRDAHELVVCQVGHAARVSRNAQQVGVVQHHDLVVERHLHVEFDAVAGGRGRGECGERILRRDRARLIRCAVARLHRHAACECDVFAALPRVLLAQAGARVVQAAVRVGDLRQRGHIVLALVAERARRHRPQSGTCGERSANQDFLYGLGHVSSLGVPLPEPTARQCRCCQRTRVICGRAVWPAVSSSRCRRRSIRTARTPPSTPGTPRPGCRR